MPRHLASRLSQCPCHPLVAQQGLYSSVHKCENFILVLCMYLRVLMAPRMHNIPFFWVHNPTPGKDQTAPRQRKLEGKFVYFFSDYPTAHTNNITSARGGWRAYPSL